MTISESVLLEALREALNQVGSDDAMTTGELARALGWGEAKVRRVLRRLAEEGRLETVRAKRVNLGGYISQVCAYRLTGGTEMG